MYNLNSTLFLFKFLNYLYLTDDFFFLRKYRTITGEARNALIELIMKNCKYDELNWAELCLKKTDTYHRLMEVASEMTQYKHESSMEITDRTRTVVGVCLNVMYEQMYDDPRRNSFVEWIDSFIK